MPSFFDEYSRFYESSKVGTAPLRLALRHHAIIESNRAVFKGARVLDLASHDGRWSFAALKAGAVHVTGIEVRPHLVDAAIDNMRFYGIDPNSYDFRVGDLNHQRQAPVQCDVALCLGYFYHTLNHLALMEYLASTQARHLILDGVVVPGDAEVIQVYTEPVQGDGAGLTDAGIYKGKILVGHPSIRVLIAMLRHFGYESAVFDWAALLAEHGIVPDPTRGNGPDKPVNDYACSIRTTLLATRHDA